MDRHRARRVESNRPRRLRFRERANETERNKKYRFEIHARTASKSRRTAPPFQTTRGALPERYRLLPCSLSLRWSNRRSFHPFGPHIGYVVQPHHHPARVFLPELRQ